MTVVLTAFEPFGPWTLNSTVPVVAAAAERLRAAGVSVRTAVLPVDLESSKGALDAVLDEPAEAVVCCGLSGRAEAIHVERVGINVADFRIPDAAGRRPIDLPLDPDGPDAYLARVPVRALADALVADGIPAVVSETAGTYLCNAVYYRALAHGRRRGVPTVFLHLPPTAAALAAAAPSHGAAGRMDEALQVRAVVRVAHALRSGHPEA